jgi:glycosyltransferase involved in cell wall biosynthesis
MSGHSPPGKPPGKVRVLVAHNAYRHRGGEDAVMEAEVELLRCHGHIVEMYARHNDDIVAMSATSLARQTLWSGRTTREVGSLMQSFRPDVIHVHNTFPLISPALYWAAARGGVPVVQTLHNFRLLCPQAMFLRAGKVCEDCLGHLPWRGAVRGCYRDSPAQSALLAAMLTLHRALGTYSRKITRFIALNEFCRGKFIAGGLPAERIAVKANFVDFAAPPVAARAGFLFVGRLSAEKGITVLKSAWVLLASTDPEARLCVAGSGPESTLLAAVPGLTALGALPGAAVQAQMQQSVALVMPSLWYENFPRTLVEAYACGLPVIASRLGAMAELVEEGVTGLLFNAGDAGDLAAKLAWAQANPERMAAMGRNARIKYEAEFTAERNYAQLMAIYADAIRDRQAERRQ